MKPWRPYERPPLSKAVLTDEPEPPIAYFHAAERYAEQRIELLLGTTVTRTRSGGASRPAARTDSAWTTTGCC